MAGDIEALKKGGALQYKSVTIETLPEATKAAAAPSAISKLSFPKTQPANSPAAPAPRGLPDLQGLSEVGPKEDNSKPQAAQPLTPPRPLAKEPYQPFNAPISKPMPPFESKNEVAAAPLDLPTAPPAPTPPIPPQPLTPPPRPARPMPPPLPPLPKGPPSLPPLPPLPKAPTYSGGGSKKKLFILMGLGAVLVVFIIGEIWWFFLREQTSPPPETITKETELLPPPQEVQPLLPAEETAPAAAEPELPAGLLSYERTETLELANMTPAALGTALKSLNAESISPDELVKLSFKSSAAGAPAKTDPSITLDDIVQALKLRIPQSVGQYLADDFDLFAFGANRLDEEECARAKNSANQCRGPRLGLAVKTSDPVNIKTALRNWEKTMVTDLKPLILAKPGQAASAAFLNGSYQSQVIRYKNLPLSTITVEYAVAGDVLIIATSKSSMLKAIDAALSENPENSAGQNF